jgi:hypothetical protein
VCDYELPYDLLYFDAETYDEFILDYDTEICKIIKRVGYNSNGTVYKLSEPREIIITPYPSILLPTGDYTISLVGYATGYIFARLMGSNIYTTQFPTKSEMNSAISASAEDINLRVDYIYNNYSTTTQMTSEIDAKADQINLSVSENYVGKPSVIASINLTSETATIDASKININGVITAINNGAITTIDGNKITTGTITSSQIATGAIDASKVSADIITTTNFSAQNIDASQITSGVISTDRLSASVITTSNFSAQNIDASKITSGTLSVDRLDSSVITTNNISAQIISADNIRGGTLFVGNNSHYFRMGTTWARNPEVTGLTIMSNDGLNMNGHSVGACYNIGTQYISASGSDGVVKCNTVFQAEHLKYKDDGGTYRDVVGLYRWYLMGKDTNTIAIRDIYGNAHFLKFDSGVLSSYQTS